MSDLTKTEPDCLALAEEWLHAERPGDRLTFRAMHALRDEVVRLRGACVAVERGRRELLCQMCGRDHPVWSVDSDLWNAVMREGGRDEYPFVCPTCFAVRAAFMGVAHSFRLSLRESVIRVGMDDSWPSGISNGLELACWRCKRLPELDYTVTDEAWERWVPEEHRLGVTCLDCLMILASEIGERIGREIVRVQWVGMGETVEFLPSRIVEYWIPPTPERQEES